MQPRKDYEDYTRFINDTFADEKIYMLNQTVDMESKRNSATDRDFKPAVTLRTYSDFKEPPFSKIRSGFATGKHNRTLTETKNQTETEKMMGSTFVDFDVKPKILESKISTKEDFFNLSDGFKRIFAKDKKDVKMVIPIAGYGGHRRGDRS